MSINASKRSSSTAQDSKKRTGEALLEPVAKMPKAHPFFSKSTSTGPFQWLPSLGPKKTCHHGINLSPPSRAKVAAFDLDGTLINGRMRGTATPENWEWWRDSIPGKLKELHEEGFSVVVISNQKIGGKIENWKLKVANIAKAIPDLPFRILAAGAQDRYRKPLLGMWDELVRIFAEDGITIDKEQSFFVGDAAGRAAHDNQPKDHSSSDRGWAANAGLQFYTPDEYFLQKQPLPFKWLGYDPSSYQVEPLFLSTSSPLIPSPPEKELVIFTGYPCVGKTTLYRTHFEPAGYVHVNQDILKTRGKCVKLVEDSLKEGKSCVVDNTNKDEQTRKYYVDVAKKLKVPVRCFLFDASKELALHNNMYRAYNRPPSVASREPEREAIPTLVFNKYQKESKDQAPKMTEGFSEIKRIAWVFNGTDEEKRYWSMWHT